MKRALDSCSVVAGKRTDPLHDMVEFALGNRAISQVNGPVREPGFGLPPEIHEDFDQVLQVRLPVQGLAHSDG